MVSVYSGVVSMWELLTTFAQPFRVRFRSLGGGRFSVLALVVADTTVGVLTMRANSPFGPQALNGTGGRMACWGGRPAVVVLTWLGAIEVVLADTASDARELDRGPSSSGMSQWGALAIGSGGP